MTTTRLWRAADDDYIDAESASFACDRGVAEAYMANGGFGGRRLWYADVDLVDMLDLTGDDAMSDLMAILGRDRDFGAIGVDELVPRVAAQLCDAGYQWVRVRESYPADTITYIYVGGVLGDEPELLAAD